MGESDRTGVVVVGAANLDLEAAAPIVLLGDSNPGTVRRGAGGVGRNIAENLARLDVDVRLLTILDETPDGRWLAAITSKAGVDMGPCEHLADTPSTYLSVIDGNGELVVAVNDMRGVAAMTPAWLAERADDIDAAAVLVVDANLTPQALRHLAERHSGDVVAEPVSEVKAVRLRPHLAWLHTVKPNRGELAALTDRHVTSDTEMNTAIDDLLRAGVRQVVVSLGIDGVIVATTDERTRLAGRAADVASVTGAGDAMTAGLVVGLVEGWDVATGARFAQAVAACTTNEHTAVDPSLNRAAVVRRLESWS